MDLTQDNDEEEDGCWNQCKTDIQQPARIMIGALYTAVAI